VKANAKSCGLPSVAPHDQFLLGHVPIQAATTKAQFLVAIAQNDDKQAPTEKDVMKETFAKAGVPAEVEVYPAMHGWCPPDSGVYSEPQAEKAWSRLLVLYGKALA
jgi:carboxymethylenebutenolidase